MTNKAWFSLLRGVGYLEGISFLLLLGIAMPLKYMYDMPEYVRVIGMAHGALFIAYVALVLWVGSKFDWSYRTIGLGVLASILPFGPFVAEKRLFQPAETAHG